MPRAPLLPLVLLVLMVLPARSSGIDGQVDLNACSLESTSTSDRIGDTCAASTGDTAGAANAFDTFGIAGGADATSKN